jgi:hypothetical protein
MNLNIDTTIAQHAQYPWTLETDQGARIPVLLPNRTSIIEALARCLHDIDAGITSGGDLFSRVQTSELAKGEWIPFIPAAQEVADFWRFEFMHKKLIGDYLDTKWQNGVVELIKDLHRPIIQDELKLLVSLPRFTKVQKTYQSWKENFKSIDFQYNSLHKRNLKFVEKLDKRRKNAPAQTWYAFADEDNQLIILPVFSGSIAATMMEHILKLQDGKLSLDAHISHTRIDTDFYVGLLTSVSLFC